MAIIGEVKTVTVLNLIISGIPSILREIEINSKDKARFKPYYNWNTFNTKKQELKRLNLCIVLNLIITGIPSILEFANGLKKVLLF